MSYNQYIELIENITSGKSFNKSSKETTQEVVKNPRLFLKANGDIKRINVSQSLMSRIVYKGEKTDACWRKLYHTELIRDIDTLATKSQGYGNYFETKCIGKGAYETMDELPLLKNGKKSVDHQRIDEQVFLFHHLAKERGIILMDDLSNVQVRNSQRYDMEGFESIEVFVEGTADIISPLSYEDYNFDVANIDLKLSLDRFTTRGYYTWGNLEWMDHTQAYMYAFLFNMPFLYWVFDYKSSDRGERMILVNTDIEHKDHKKANEARIRFKELHEGIRTTCAAIYDQHIRGYETNPEYNRCKNCPILDCKDRVKIEEY